MQAEIIGIEDGIVGVRVVDPRGNTHLVEIDVDEQDTIDLHAQEAYPLEASDQTEDVQRIMDQVLARARFEAHTQTEYDILRSGWDPTQLRRGIDALESISDDEFDNLFYEYYMALHDPTGLKDEYDIGPDTAEVEGDPRIALVIKSFCIDDQNEIVNDLPLFVFYSSEQADKNYTAGPDPDCPSGTTEIPSMLPPFKDAPADFIYPEDFRGLMINNLICQIRDIYRNMGERPPKQYDIDGFGKPHGNFDR
ncbi:hypothetical protein [Halobiforma nitratireducens]|uniref:Uncharacterized protein n=1 Tax=Halobiforma nitratireducens JCM 10879 TaxID=1227454 RepID=M0LAZ2_9EURY|nr:hypothetical protein [Halobiforma nitratireducens]EMA29115.1 hypothetical protein C446_17499 [Halobiforma nitratireducens JCM 10879]